MRRLRPRGDHAARQPRPVAAPPTVLALLICEGESGNARDLFQFDLARLEPLNAVANPLAFLRPVDDEVGVITFTGFAAGCVTIAGDVWSPRHFNPSDTMRTSVLNAALSVNTITLFVGVSEFFGWTVGDSVSGTSSIGTFQPHGWTGFVPLGGSSTFDHTQN